MSKEPPTEVFMPPNMLKAKVGGTIAGLDMAAVKRAETAMETLKEEFSGWIATDIKKLGEAYDAFVATNDLNARGDLFRASHDLKGQAATFEFPLISRVASSLSKLIDTLAADEPLPLPIVDAHINAIRVIYRDKIKDISNLTAITLIEELEGRVRETLERAAAKAPRR